LVEKRREFSDERKTIVKKTATVVKTVAVK